MDTPVARPTYAEEKRLKWLTLGMKEETSKLALWKSKGLQRSTPSNYANKLGNR